MSDKVIDYELTKGLQQAKRKPQNFALIAKGANCLRLFVSRKPITGGLIQEDKKECQGNVVVRGVCVGGGGPDIVFQVPVACSIAAPKLKRFIADQTGLSLKPEFQVVSDLEEINE